MIDTIKKIAGKGQERQETTFRVRLEGNMANITLPYGRENKTVCIPDERLRGPWFPERMDTMQRNRSARS